MTLGYSGGGASLYGPCLRELQLGKPGAAGWPTDGPLGDPRIEDRGIPLSLTSLTSQHLGSQTGERKRNQYLRDFFEQLNETSPEPSTPTEIFNTF